MNEHSFIYYKDRCKIALLIHTFPHYLKNNFKEVDMMVDLLLNEDDKLLQDMLQKFAEKEIAPLATKRDEEEYFDWNVFHKMGENGLTGVPWPVKYGGSGM